MRVLMISDLQSEGGAAIAASRLADALAEDGVDLTRAVVVGDDRDHAYSTLHPYPRPALLAARALLKRPMWERISWMMCRSWLTRILQDVRPHVINLHNIHWAGWPPEVVSLCVRSAPTVWTLHDMWSFTGRCVYSYDCLMFQTGCTDSCPTPREYPMMEPSRISESWIRRKEIFQQAPGLVAVSPSRWLAGKATEGLWGGHRVEVIPYGVPLDTYRPVDKSAARAALGINPTRPLVLVSAQNLSDRRKGGPLLLELLSSANAEEFDLLTLGYGVPDQMSTAVRVHRLGYVAEESKTALAYAAADLLLHAAPVDNLPNVVIESLSSGTPVVAFATGGIPEMVRPDTTGWLSEELSSQALLNVLRTALSEVRSGETRTSACRQFAEREYDPSLQASRYMNLFHSMSSTSEDLRRASEIDGAP